jgi:hypothetical protein
MDRCHRRLTLAPLAPTALSNGVSPVTLAGSGLTFDRLGSDCSGSEVDEEDGIPFQVASQALEEESDEGWTPVGRKKKTESETVADFWREIGFLTSASRFFEKSRRCDSLSGESSRFCRSVDVYGAMEKQSTPTPSPPVGSPSLGAVSSPTGVRLARGPKVGTWWGPLPRRRISPPPILGQFLDKAARSSSSRSCSATASSGRSSVMRARGCPEGGDAGSNGR